MTYDSSSRSTQLVTPFYSLDIILLACPIVVPLVFYSLLSTFPGYKAAIFVLGMLLLADTHFAATWLFFIDKRNWPWLHKRPFLMYVVPALIVLGLPLIWYFTSLSLMILVSSVGSAWHVTRQSIGIMKLFLPAALRPFANYFASLIYSFSFLFLLVGLWRFYLHPSSMPNQVAPERQTHSASLTLTSSVSGLPGAAGVGSDVSPTAR